MEKRKENIKIKETSDIQLASVLHCEGYPFKGVNKTHPKKVVFIFQDIEGIEQTAQAFLSDQVKLPPRKLFDSYNLLKRLVFENDF